MDLQALSANTQSEISTEYNTRVLKSAKNQQELDGQNAVALIQSAAAAAPPPVGPDGKGVRLNTYA